MGIIDWPRFNENFQYYDQTIIKEIIDIFIEEYDNRIATLQKNIEEKDFTGLAFNAHSMKSVIGNYMAPIPYELSRKLEEKAKNNAEAEVPVIFLELKNSTQELIAELKNYLQTMDH